MEKEALFYEKSEANVAHCLLCNHLCRIAEGDSGFCGVRYNKGGVLWTRAYRNPVSGNIDPVEKKPLYHFLPGTLSMSIAFPGCNFRCGFCQNWQISQDVSLYDGVGKEKEFSPQDTVDAAIANRCASISYTYTEPTVFMEYALDTCAAAHKKGLKNIFVTNGYMTARALRSSAGLLDAANVDIKFFREESYGKFCAARLAPVLDSVRLMKEMGIWVEITTLVIPGLNDSDQELSKLAAFISGLDRDMPWHVSRFYPDYKFNAYKSTPEETIRKAVDIGRKTGLNYVYAGNVSGWGGDTYCPQCQSLLIKREIFSIMENGINKGKCFCCGKVLPGVY